MNKNIYTYMTYFIIFHYLPLASFFEWEIKNPPALKASKYFQGAAFCPPFQFAAIFQVDFQLLNEKGETSSFIANGEWALLGKMYSLYNLNTVIGNLSGKYPHPLITQTEDGEQFPFFLCTHKC